MAPDSPEVMAIEVKVDSRVEKLQNFFEKYGSPLAKNSKTFIEVADKYNLDWSLLPAIAGAESTFGKYVPSCADYNPFGWTSTTSPCGFWRFGNYDEAIRYVGEKITTKNAYSEFRNTREVKDLSIPYNGGNKEWVKNVEIFMEELI